MSWTNAMVGALLSTATRPRSWAIALAGFLVRGGVLVVVLPILVIPSVAGLSITLAPLVAGIVLDGPTPALIGLVAALVAVVAAWLLVTGLVGVWFDLALIEDAAADDELLLATDTIHPGARQTLAVRLGPHLVSMAALAAAALKIGGVTYDELVAPSSPGTPLPVRVALRTPAAVALVVIAWAFAEAVGGLAVRQLATSRPGGNRWRALSAAVRAAVRPSGIATLALTDLVVLATVIPVWLASARAWDHLRVLLVDGATASEITMALAVLVFAWLAGLALVGAAVAWRSTAWTAEYLRRPATALAPALVEQ